MVNIQYKPYRLPIWFFFMSRKVELKVKLQCNLNERSYDIVIERGILQSLNKVLDCNRRYFVITDEGVPKQHVNKVIDQCPKAKVFTIPQGESSKCFTWYEACLKEMLNQHYTRNDCVIALGGGVVGDLAGFVAASYMRGISFINIPTTTLSQIDSSIGGKVGIDVEGTKNCVGAFWQPQLVLIDPNVLQTLSTRHLYNGLIEALKAGLIADKELFEIFETKDILENIDEIILRALEVKRKVVEEDEKEMGIRKILNFGHTIGHGYESATNFSQYYHGECVGLGMLAILEDEVLKKRTRLILEKMNCPATIECDRESVYHYVLQDKKSNGETITIVQVNELGHAELNEKSFSDLERLIKTL